MPLYEPAATSSAYLQTVYQSLAVDTTTTSTSFVDLMTQSVTTSGGKLAILFSAASTNSAAGRNTDFQLLVDGVAVEGCGIRVSAATVPEASSINYLSALLSPGAHTIKIQWKTSASTAQLNVVTNANQSATLLIQEVLV